MEGILDVSGVTTLNSTLNVAKAATVSGLLNVVESSTFEKNLNVDQSATIGLNLTLKGSLISGTGASAKTLSATTLGYLSDIESDLQTQLNSLKFTTNKRMYVNDQTSQNAEYSLTIGSDTLDYKYTPNVFAATNRVPYRDLAAQDITFRGKKIIDGSEQRLEVDFAGCTSTDTASFVGIVDETGSNTVTNNALVADTGTDYGIHPVVSTGTADITNIIGIHRFKGMDMASSLKMLSGTTITMTSGQASGNSVKGDGAGYNINVAVDISGTSVDLSGIGDTDAKQPLLLIKV